LVGLNLSKMSGKLDRREKQSRSGRGDRRVSTDRRRPDASASAGTGAAVADRATQANALAEIVEVAGPHCALLFKRDNAVAYDRANYDLLATKNLKVSASNSDTISYDYHY
jgi:hypothetical protein